MLSLRTADNLKKFKTHLHLCSNLRCLRGMAKHDLRCMQFADSACKVVQRVTDYHLQQHQKLFEPFLAKCQKVIVPRRLFFAAQQRIAITWRPKYYKKMRCFITREGIKKNTGQMSSKFGEIIKKL